VDSPVLLHTLLAVARSSQAVGDLPQARDSLRRYLEVAEAAQIADAGQRWRVLSMLSRMESLQEHAEEALSLQREAVAALATDEDAADVERAHQLETLAEMEILHGKSEDIVRKEIYMHLLAYNLIRALMWQAAQEHGRPLHRLSFAGTVQRLQAVAPYLWLFAGTSKATQLHTWLLSWIARDILPDRPNRLEPRALKRRPKPYALLTRPRNEMRKVLLS
jgi:hypothetical protein